MYSIQLAAVILEKVSTGTTLGSQVVVLRSFLTTMGKERVASQFFLAQCGGPIFVLRKIPIDPIVRDISLDVPMLVQQLSEQ